MGGWLASPTPTWWGGTIRGEASHGEGLQVFGQMALLLIQVRGPIWGGAGGRWGCRRLVGWLALILIGG